MKLKELKHNHSLTDLLKILIFSVLMITPLLSVATRCLYVICNKNAYQSAEITQTTYNKSPLYTTNDPTNNYIEGNTYLLQIALNNHMQEFINTDIIGDNGLYQIQFYNTNLNGLLFYDNFNILNKNFDYLSFDLSLNQLGEITIILHGDDTTDEIEFDYRILYKPQLQETCYLNFYFTLIEMPEEININTTYFNIYELPNEMQKYEATEVESTTLDNVFEYSVNKLQESQIINWTANTSVYTGVSTMTTQLGIEGAVIPMLITYWFLLTIIYVIIDIVLKLFTVLTHLIGSKTT